MIGVAALLREHGRSAFLTQTISSKAGVEGAAPYLSTLADAILLLDYDISTVDLNRSIRVLKMRGSAHSTQARRLQIRSGGLNVEKLSAPSSDTATG